MNPVEFTIWSAGKGQFCFVSRCHRWHARQGNYGTMILTDRTTSEMIVVKGKMPEVIAEVNRRLGKPQGKPLIDIL